MPQFRKKPVVIEAERIPLTQDGSDLVRWGRLGVWLSHKNNNWQVNDTGGVDIETLEGVLRGDPGDWIIRGVAGEIYPCKPHIFEATYDVVL